METRVRAVVDKVASWYRTSEQALNQCNVAREHIVVELERMGFTDFQRLQVSGPIGSTHPHPDLHPGHQVLRIGTEVVDVTWAQIDIIHDDYLKVYPSIRALRSDWTDVRDWLTLTPI